MTAPRTYVTLLTTDDYLDGVLVLHASLKRVGSKFGLLALIVGDVSTHNEAMLRSFGIGTKRITDKIAIPSDILQANVDRDLGHWNNAFSKLFIFDLIEFEKIVYLDSDMLILRNIDHLFQQPHMSAVVAGRSFPGNESWKELNAGLMVVVPEAGLSTQILGVLPKAAATSELVSDQTLLHHYDEQWPLKESLHLDERYNVFSSMLDHYVDRVGYGLFGADGIAVVHFIGASKPWLGTWARQWERLSGLRHHRKHNELKINTIYLRTLMTVRLLKWIKRARRPSPEHSPAG